jgi:acyl-CoA synthetase (AMP-forming)/AMP-acid ligase II
MSGAFRGARVVLVAKFDPARVLRLVDEERVNTMLITGDAMARPLIDALERSSTDYDLSSLSVIGSTAALFSPAMKDRLMELLPHVVLTDAIGSSESGSNGYSIVEKGNTAMKGGPTVRAVRDAVVLDDDLHEVQPGSGTVGKVARKGNIPLEYYKDPVKTEQTFVTAPDGTRYAVPGDFATLEVDGTITLLGRGSVSINSGGEKIFPEEVEGAVRHHVDVYDAVVVGVPDEKWGQRVAAVVQPRAGAKPPLESVQDECRRHIAGYKVPREIHYVDRIERSPSGKPDYRWAAAVALGEIAPV